MDSSPWWSDDGGGRDSDPEFDPDGGGGSTGAAAPTLWETGLRRRRPRPRHDGGGRLRPRDDPRRDGEDRGTAGGGDGDGGGPVPPQPPASWNPWHHQQQQPQPQQLQLQLRRHGETAAESPASSSTAAGGAASDAVQAPADLDRAVGVGSSTDAAANAAAAAAGAPPADPPLSSADTADTADPAAAAVPEATTGIRGEGAGTEQRGADDDDAPPPAGLRHRRSAVNSPPRPRGAAEPLTDREAARTYGVVSFLVVLAAVFTGGPARPAPAVTTLPPSSRTPPASALLPAVERGSSPVPAVQHPSGGPAEHAASSSSSTTTWISALGHAAVEGDHRDGDGGGTGPWWEFWGGHSRGSVGGDRSGIDVTALVSSAVVNDDGNGNDALPIIPGEKTLVDHHLFEAPWRTIRLAWKIVSDANGEGGKSGGGGGDPVPPLPPPLTSFQRWVRELSKLTPLRFGMRDFWNPRGNKTPSTAAAWWQRPLSSPSTWTDLLDKVLNSTWRLLAVANLLLALTYLLHMAVVEWFLDGDPTSSRANGAGAADNPAAATHALPPATEDGNPLGGGAVPNLIFKMLLVSAIVAPDTLDWMILLTWYTLLTFLRSLSNTCAARLRRTALAAPSAGGGAAATPQPVAPNPPPRGVAQLLLAVVVSNAAAAAACVGLFHGAGWNMVALLTCDCAVVVADALAHLLECALQHLECHHLRRLNEVAVAAAFAAPSAVPQPPPQPTVAGAVEDPQQRPLSQLPPSPRAVRLDALEQQHARRTHILEFAVFLLQVGVQVLTSLHFLHLWSLHGFQSTLIDGVLALQLHTAVTAAARKVRDRRHLGRIARELDGLLRDATPDELAKADDVCCICLCSLSSQVKKVNCGHFYHASCLRELVERARSLEAAKCPLCRTSIVPTEGPPSAAALPTPDTGAGNTAAGPVDAAAPVREAPANRAALLAERALFRFSTEEVLPEWLPLPAFAFEVVRRPAPVNNINNAPPPQEGAGVEQPLPRQEGPGRPRGPPSLLRRALALAGAWVPLTPEEEAVALDQLVDMFPQHERRHLQRELQRLGSAERVANAVLAGAVGGGAADTLVAPAR